MWDGFWFVANRRSFEALPPAVRDIVRTAVNSAAMKQREDVARLNEELRATIAKTVEFVRVDPKDFRNKLQESGFYSEWKKRMGDEAWNLLESTTGKLA
jgi:TRAP-type C4-dicarboxylate transport system substrate-binding protein